MAELQRALLQRLSGGADARLHEAYLPGQSASALGVPVADVYEALWSLLGQGLLYIDPAGQATASTWDNYRWTLTAAGRAAAKGGSWEPHDPEGYLDRLRERAPALEPAALTYVTEALRAFNARCFLSTSVMLGVATEQVFEGLAESLVSAHPAETGQLAKLLENRHTTQYRRFSEFRRRLEPLRPSLPDDLADVITLDAVADLLRVTRNEAGHPTGRLIDEDTAYTHLKLAGVLLAKMIDLTEYFHGVTAQSS